jgi:hypothetical protein
MGVGSLAYVEASHEASGWEQACRRSSPDRLVNDDQSTTILSSSILDIYDSLESAV